MLVNNWVSTRLCHRAGRSTNRASAEKIASRETNEFSWLVVFQLLWGLENRNDEIISDVSAYMPMPILLANFRYDRRRRAALTIARQKLLQRFLPAKLPHGLFAFQITSAILRLTFGDFEIIHLYMCLKKLYCF